MSLLTSFTRPVGGSQLPFVETYDGRLLNTNGVLTQNAAHLVRFRVGAPLPITTAEWYVTVQNGNVNAGVFTFDGTNYNPLTTTGSTAAGAANALQSAALATAVTLVPFVDYWAAIATDSATFACLRLTAVSTSVGGAGSKVLVKTSNFALAQITSGATGNNILPFIRLK